MTSLLFSTGVRQRSLINIKVKDIDFDNDIVHVNVTKNRKPLLVPINKTMSNILKEFLKYRQHKNMDDYLFCNIFGKQLVKATSYTMLYNYNKRRGVQTTGIHRYRHTFAKQWILNGGNVVSLSKLLGHSSLDITQNYIHLLVSDVAKQVNEINVLDKFYGKQRIKMTKK
jgi:integrase/recombinase XerD